VIGKDVPFALLQEVADTPGDALRAGLTHLVATEFVYETSLFPDLEYTFKHALTHDVAYGGLLHERRRALHERVVTAIERICSERPADQVERLAHHALRAERWEKAAQYARRAGAKAAAQSAYRAAVERFEEALAALARLPETTQVLMEITDVHLELRTPLFNLGEFDRILPHVREAERIARQLGDARRRAIAANWLSAKHWDMGELSEAREWAEVTLALANSLDDEPLRGMGHYNIGRALLAAGQYRRAIESFRSGTDATGDYRAYARAWTCWALAGLGEFEEAFAEGRRGVEMAMRPPVLVQMCQSLGRGLLVKGDVETAAPVLGRGLAVAEEYDLTLLLHLARIVFGYMRALRGDADEACDIVERSLKALRGMYATGWVLWGAEVGGTFVLAGRHDDAIAFAEDLIVLARRVGAAGPEASALQFLGDAVAATGDGGDGAAAQSYRHALALAEALSMRPLAAHGHAGLARLAFRAGRRADAGEHLATATAMYRGMGMTYWLEKLARDTSAFA
jgi:tetratricopeptide (TPR) repeat protein